MTVTTRLLASLATLLALALPVSGCGPSAPDAPQDIREAAASIKGSSSPRMLTRSAFYVAYPDGKPTDYVNYIFSTMGSAEMPYAFDEFEAEQMRSIGQVPFPSTVTLVPHSRDATADRQLVVSADDERGMLIVRGYLKGTEEPVLEKEWELKKVSPAPGVSEMYQSNVQMGMDSGY